MNIFKGMTWLEIGVIVTLSILLAITTGLLIIAIIYLLPIDDKAKTLALFILGFVSILVGYAVLIAMRPNKKNRKPAASKPADHFQDSCSGVNETNRILCHTPNPPNIATEMRKIPRTMQPRTTRALTILSNSFVNLFRLRKPCD
jgi:hypothetical protein